MPSKSCNGLQILIAAYLILIAAYLISIAAYLILIAAYLILIAAYLILIAAYLILIAANVKLSFSFVFAIMYSYNIKTKSTRVAQIDHLCKSVLIFRSINVVQSIQAKRMKIVKISIHPAYQLIHGKTRQKRFKNVHLFCI